MKSKSGYFISSSYLLLESEPTSVCKLDLYKQVKKNWRADSPGSHLCVPEEDLESYPVRGMNLTKEINEEIGR